MNAMLLLDVILCKIYFQIAPVEQEDDIFDGLDEIDDSVHDTGDVMAAYFADGSHTRDRPAVYCPELGVAIEQLPESFTLQTLWEVIPS